MAGIRGFYTPTGVGTVVAEGKPTEMFEGRSGIRESWLKAEPSIIEVWKADSKGNLVLRKTARNFDPVMATAGKVTVVEVVELVGDGDLGTDNIQTPGVFADVITDLAVFETAADFVSRLPA